MTLTADARHIDTPPARILDVMTGIHSYNGVPVMIIQPDDMPGDLAAMRRQGADQIAAAEQATWPAHPVLRWLRRAGDMLMDTPCNRLRDMFNHRAESIFYYVANQMKDSGTVIPCAFLDDGWDGMGLQFAHTAGRGRLRAAAAAIVVAPPRNFSMARLLLASGFYAGGGQELEEGDGSAFLYMVLNHELAHVGCAAEPQADKIAALFTRRAFPGSAVPQVVADVRAITCMARAVRAAAHPSVEADEQLRRYGWEMVEAGDSAAAMPQGIINRMTDQQIIGTRFERPVQRHGALLRAGRFISDLWPENGLRRRNPVGSNPDIHMLALSAEKLKDYLPRLAGDPAAQAIINRFIDAATRLSDGIGAYRPRTITPAP
jgi:hypothetical protein